MWESIKYVNSLRNHFKANTHLITTQVQMQDMISNQNPPCTFLSPRGLAMVLLFDRCVALFYTFAVHAGTLKPQRLMCPLVHLACRLTLQVFSCVFGFCGSVPRVCAHQGWGLKLQLVPFLAE